MCGDSGLGRMSSLMHPPGGPEDIAPEGEKRHPDETARRRRRTSRTDVVDIILLLLLGKEKKKKSLSETEIRPFEFLSLSFLLLASRKAPLLFFFYGELCAEY